MGRAGVESNPFAHSIFDSGTPVRVAYNYSLLSQIMAVREVNQLLRPSETLTEGGSSKLAEAFVGKIRKAMLAMGVLGFALLAGCGGGYYAGVSYGPPAPIVEGPIGVAPGPGYIWTDGYYDWDGGHYNWHRGNWRRRPGARSEWVRPNWERHGNHYRFRQGHWRNRR